VSMADLLPEPPSMSEVMKAIAGEFASEFGWRVPGDLHAI
jgi:hypothetical protein